MKYTIGIADDQQLFLKSLSSLIDTLPNFEVVFEAHNGEDCCHKLTARAQPPDMLLLDVNMPVMDGAATAAWVAARYPGVRMVALSMKEDEMSIIKMIRAGCCAYLTKNMHPTDLEKALTEVSQTGYYNSDPYNSRYRQLALRAAASPKQELTPRELQFLQLAGSDMTYKQIADKMMLSDRTIDGYRESIFEKFKVQSRVGMVMEGLKRELINLHGEKDPV